jgi:glycerol-3-phosphate cytidylyltransferase-like family protein
MSTCATCIYWRSSNRTCHKSPPAPVHGFAVVAGNDWCGEHATESQPLMAAKQRAPVVAGVSQERVDALLREEAAKMAAQTTAQIDYVRVEAAQQRHAERKSSEQMLAKMTVELDRVRSEAISDMKRVEAEAARQREVAARLAGEIARLRAEAYVPVPEPEPVRVDAERPRKTWRERLGI